MTREIGMLLSVCGFAYAAAVSLGCIPMGSMYSSRKKGETGERGSILVRPKAHDFNGIYFAKSFKSSI